MKLKFDHDVYYPLFGFSDDGDEDHEKKKKKKKKGEKKKKYEKEQDLVAFLNNSKKRRRVVIKDNREKYKRAKSRFSNHLLVMMKRMNGYNGRGNSSDYIYGAMGRQGSPKASIIFQTSQLWRGKTEVTEIEGQLFKYRFLTFLYSDVIRNIDQIVDWEMENTGRRLTEDMDRYNILKRLMSAVSDFSQNLLSEETSSMKSFVDMDYFLYQSSSKRKRLVIETMVEHLNVIIDNQSFMRGNYLDEYIVINDLMKLAYVAVTDSANLKHTFPIVQNVDFKNKAQLRNMLMKLGEDITEYRRINNNKHSRLYDIFLYSRPDMETGYMDVNRNTSLRVGIRAMFYLGFIANDKKVWKLINRIVG